MKKRIIGIFLAAVFALSALGFTANADGTIEVPKAASPITIDGNIDGSEWNGALVFDIRSKYPDYTNDSSVFKMKWDDNFLYVGYCGVYDSEQFAGTDFGGFCSGENCTITVMDSLTAESYTNHISMTPNLTVKNSDAFGSVLNQPNLMSYHKDTGAGVWYPDNAKQTNNESDVYWMEAKIPFTEVNLDRSKTTAAVGDSFFININVYFAGQLLNVTNGTETFTLGDVAAGDSPSTADWLVSAVLLGTIAAGAALVLCKKKIKK